MPVFFGFLMSRLQILQVAIPIGGRAAAPMRTAVFSLPIDLNLPQNNDNPRNPLLHKFRGCFQKTLFRPLPEVRRVSTQILLHIAREIRRRREMERSPAMLAKVSSMMMSGLWGMTAKIRHISELARPKTCRSKPIPLP